MIKRIITIFINTIAIFYFYNISFAENIVGMGAHSGFHRDVGNIDSYDPDIQIDPQNNYLLGFSIKTNFKFIFTRFGADTTFLGSSGSVKENSSEIANTKIQYLSFPFFLGYNFEVLDTGHFYIGPGFSYFMARGRINSTISGLSDDISTTGWGYGFLVGMEYSLSIKISVYAEWEYLDGRSDPILQQQNTHTWEDYFVDFTGHRFLFGIRYYLL